MVYNLYKNKLDPRIVSGHFIGYAKRSKRFMFYCPSHLLRIVESINARFIENDENNGSNQPWNIIFEEIQDFESTHESLSKIVVIKRKSWGYFRPWTTI